MRSPLRGRLGFGAAYLLAVLPAAPLYASAGFRAIPTPVERLAPSPIEAQSRPTEVGTTNVGPLAPPPSIVETAPTEDGLTVRWGRADLAGAGYNVYWAEKPGVWKKLNDKPLEANEYTVRSLALPTRFMLGVSTVDLAGSGREGAISKPAEVAKQVKDNDLVIQKEGKDLRIRVNNMVLFDTGKTVIKPEGAKALDKVRNLIRTFSRSTVRVEGHTDNQAIVGNLARVFPNNQALSESRAFAVKNRLAEGGIALTDMQAEGFGDTKPIADNTTDAGRMMNRRVEIVIHPEE